MTEEPDVYLALSPELRLALASLIQDLEPELILRLATILQEISADSGYGTVELVMYAGAVKQIKVTKSYR